MYLLYCMRIHTSIFLSIYIFIHLSFHPSIFLSIYLFIHPSIHLSRVIHLCYAIRLSLLYVIVSCYMICCIYFHCFSSDHILYPNSTILKFHHLSITYIIHMALPSSPSLSSSLSCSSSIYYLM